ncbi:anaerobic ribonucleoside-triphosphate reductase-activating protein [Vibrio owensii]|uniref:anaerobic ribonucleoside-triphosphate reductase-activating protein n=1 Tax=Vibrio harveyi group TaxID=717610 RepID=UPI003CC5B910
MNYQKYFPVDVVNGIGTRATLYVSGCSFTCKGCFNKSALNPNSGKPFTKELEDRIIRDLNDTRIKRNGLSLLGGDPLFEGNLEAIGQLVERVKREAPHSTIWLWSGNKIDELDESQQEIVKNIDVFIDGQFIKELADPSLLWRGSSNQVVHYLSDRSKPKEWTDRII